MNSWLCLSTFSSEVIMSSACCDTVRNTVSHLSSFSSSDSISASFWIDSHDAADCEVIS